MKETELQWKSTDGHRLYVKIWEPEVPPNVVVSLVHGLGDHINRFNRLAKDFVGEGFAVTGFDLYGHGRSEGKRGHCSSYEVLLDDVGLLVQKTFERYPDIPQVLFGQSFGGTLVINHALRYQEKPNCIIASSPWLRLAMKVPEVKLLIAKAMKRLLPGLIQPSGLNPENLCADGEVVKRYCEDPLVHDRISLRLGYCAIENGQWAIENAGKLELPLLLMHGDQDKITSHDASKEFAENSKKHTTLKIWEGMHHELRNDPDQNRVFQFLMNWIRIYTEKEEFREF
ncbi:MAG: lysophospholipase [Bacteroidales bacterium]|nr:MAG: lysophospholipase [Bacteroidales bacterium]